MRRENELNFYPKEQDMGEGGWYEKQRNKATEGKLGSEK